MAKWYTRKLEVLVVHTVWVRVPFSAPNMNKTNPSETKSLGFVFICSDFWGIKFN